MEEAIRRLAKGEESRATMHNRNYRKDGSVVRVERHNSALRDAGGNLVSILSPARGVSSPIQAEERLRHMATHDGLTGLPNRVPFNDRLSQAISRAKRFRHGVAGMFLDLDHLRDANDTLGHRVGDGEDAESLLKNAVATGSVTPVEALVRPQGPGRGHRGGGHGTCPGPEVVAEGVERASQLKLLRELDCASFQGHFVCRPMPLGESEQWLASRSTTATVEGETVTPSRPGAGTSVRK